MLLGDLDAAHLYLAFASSLIGMTLRAGERIRTADVGYRCGGVPAAGRATKGDP